MRKRRSRLLAGVGPILIASFPAALLAQVAVNTAQVRAPAGTFETAPDNNIVVDSDALLAVLSASADTITGVRSGIGNGDAGNVLANDALNGGPASLAEVTLSVQTPAANPGVALDLATGKIAVAPSVAAGTYTITYRICEKANQSNCADATVSVTVDPAVSSVSGTVYDDRNGNQSLDGGEVRRDGWIVEVVRNGAVVARGATDTNGDYTIASVPSGTGYSIQFRNPDNNVVYRVIANVTLADNTAVTDQNLPLDPSGVVYDSITRAPLRNASVSLLGAGGAPLPVSCFLSPTQQGQSTDSSGFYRFDIVPGAAIQCPAGETVYSLLIAPPTGYSAPSTVLPAEVGAFDPTGQAGPVKISPSSNPPQAGDAVRWYQSFRLAAGDPDVIFNHVPLDPFLNRSPLVVAKTSTKRTASVGDMIPYSITVRNGEAAQRGGVDVIDILPPGFKYVLGSATVNGVAAEPVANDRELRWQRQNIPGNATITYRLVTVVGAGVSAGDRINNGLARDGLDGKDISNRGQAVVSIVPSAVFDCSEVIGKVYDDLNGDGYQDQGEPGISGARLATVNGELITTDQFGRYHIACAAVPDAAIGSNYVLKLDLRSVAQGSAPTSDNPQSIRLTRGKASELNFGVQKASTTSVSIDARTFVPGSSELKPELEAKLRSLRPQEAKRLVIRLAYQAQAGEDWALAEARIAALKAAVSRLFDQGWSGPKPVIEADLNRASHAAGRE